MSFGCPGMGPDNTMGGVGISEYMIDGAPVTGTPVSPS